MELLSLGFRDRPGHERAELSKDWLHALGWAVSIICKIAHRQRQPSSFSATACMPLALR